MAADQRRKRLNGASFVSYGSREQHRAKRKNLGLMQNDLRMRSHIAVEWDDNQKRVFAKREQIGISWRQMKPFVSFVSNDHKVLADVLIIPPEIFYLDNLKEVLSYEIWMTQLSENERNLLMNFLPHGLEPHQVVEELLAGNNFHFGNPLLKWSASLCVSDLHPDVIVDREQHLKSEKRAYYTQLHNYHNDMIEFLVKLKERWQSCKDPEKEIVQKIWRSKNDVEKTGHSNVTESRVYDHDGNFSESCSWDAEEKGCSSDNQILSLRKHDKLKRRVLEIGFGKGDKLPMRNIHSSDGGKYISCIKINKQQHELFMSMKQSSRIIQSRSVNRVLGNLDNICVQPYDVFFKEEKKFHEHWLQLANKALPAAYANWTERQRQRHAMRNSLVAEVKDKSNPLLEEEDTVSSGSEFQDKDKNNMSSADKPGDQDEDNMRSGGELQDPDEDNMSSESKLLDHNADNVSVGNVQNVQSCSNDDAVYVSRSSENQSRSLENQSPQDSYVSGSDEFNPMSTKLEKNVVSPKSDIASPNKIDCSRNRNTLDVSVNEGPSFSSSGDVWQAVDMPHSIYDSSLTREYTAQRLAIGNPQVNEEDRTCLIDLETDLHHQEETDKELLQRQLDDTTFSSYQSPHRSDLIQSLFKGEGPLSYHHEQKGSKLDFQASNMIMGDEGQFSSHFKEPLQTSLTLDQGQRRAGEVYMPENMSQNIYPNDGRYLAHRQERLVPRQNPLGAVNMTDWTDNTARIAPPSQSHWNTGDFSAHHWFPTERQVRGGWNGSDCSSLTSHSLGSATNSDQSLFSILSECNQLCPGGSYDSIRNIDQFLAQRSYGVVDAGTSRTNAVAPHASHPLEYLRGRDMPSGLVPDDMAWINLPHENSAIHDQMGKPYLRSFDR